MPSAAKTDDRLCPACSGPVVPTASTAPFCSQGCRDRDLLKWLSDGHRLPGPAADHGDYPGDGLDS